MRFGWEGKGKGKEGGGGERGGRIYYGMFPFTQADVGCGVACQGFVPCQEGGVVLVAVEVGGVEDGGAELGVGGVG